METGWRTLSWCVVHAKCEAKFHLVWNQPHWRPVNIHRAASGIKMKLETSSRNASSQFTLCFLRARSFFFSLSKSKVEPFRSSCSQPAPISSSLISDLTGISRGSPLMGSHASKCGFPYRVKTLLHVCCEHTVKGDLYIFILALDQSSFVQVKVQIIFIVTFLSLYRPSVHPVWNKPIYLRALSLTAYFPLIG